jgi:putative DNA primase/helicase
MTSARDIALALGGKRAQRCGDGTFLTCCPVPTHGRGRRDRTPSLAIRDGDTRALVKCFGGCEPATVLAELRRRGLLGIAITARGSRRATTATS